MINVSVFVGETGGKGGGCGATRVSILACLSMHVAKSWFSRGVSHSLISCRSMPMRM